MNLPENAVGYRIAAIVPCLYHSDGPTTWCPKERPCDRGCLGDGTRVVVSDVAVERTTVEVGVYDATVWREVSS